MVGKAPLVTFAIGICLLMYLVSAIFPIGMAYFGYGCSKAVSKYGAENTDCVVNPFPPDTVVTAADHYEFLNIYEETLTKLFNGASLFGVIGLLLVYEIALITSAIMLFRGNPATDFIKFFVSFGLILFDFVLSIVVFAIPMQDLVELDASFTFVAFISIPAILGCGLYFGILCRIQNIQNALHVRTSEVASRLSDVYEGAIPDRIRLNIASLSDQIALSGRFLSSGIPSVFRINKSINSSMAAYSDIENELVDHLRTRINQIESNIEDSLDSSMTVTHLNSQQVELVLNNLVSEANRTVLNRSLEEMR